MTPTRGLKPRPLISRGVVSRNCYKLRREKRRKRESLAGKRFKSSHVSSATSLSHFVTYQYPNKLEAGVSRNEHGSGWLLACGLTLRHSNRPPRLATVSRSLVIFIFPFPAHRLKKNVAMCLVVRQRLTLMQRGRRACSYSFPHKASSTNTQPAFRKTTVT